MPTKIRLICVLFICLLATSACRQSNQLAEGLTETEAQRICVLLQRNGLNAYKSKVGADDIVTWSVNLDVPPIIGDEQVASAQYILAESDLPRDRNNPLKSAFAKDSLIPTQTEESLRKIAAIQESVELKLESASGVVRAHVSIVLPNPNPLVESSKQIQASASVFIKYNTQNEPLTAQEVRDLVAGSVEGLDPNRVAIVMKAVAQPDINKFKDLKEYYVRIIAIAAVSFIFILSALLGFFMVRTRTLRTKVTQLERSLALRPATAKAATSQSGTSPIK